MTRTVDMRILFVALLALTGGAGCGSNLRSARGQVVWEDGLPAKELAGGLVVCESEDGRVGARGDIQADGSFELSTHKPGDGLMPGKHRVAVIEYRPGEPPPPPRMDRAFSDLQTSGLHLVVDGNSDDIILRVRRAKSAARK